MVIYAAMLGQILITVAVAAIAYLALRSRGRQPSLPERPQRPRIPPRLMRGLAYGLAGAMVAGSAWYLIERWAVERELVTVQVINANTGRITLYQARRGAVKGRGFVTLDGQQVRLADVERMILRDADEAIPPQVPADE